jgi:hypothetical protein
MSVMPAEMVVIVMIRVSAEGTPTMDNLTVKDVPSMMGELMEGLVVFLIGMGVKTIIIALSITEIRTLILQWQGSRGDRGMEIAVATIAVLLAVKKSRLVHEDQRGGTQCRTILPSWSR